MTRTAVPPVRTRPERPAERAAVLDVVTRAFADGGEVARLVQALDASPDRLPGMSFVALAGDRVVGHVLGTRGLLDTRERLVDVVVLSPLAVDPDHQRRGIGRGLVEALVEGAAASGAPYVVLEGAPDVYGRFGFVAAEGIGLRRPSLRIPASAFQARALPARTDGMTGTIVYSRVFWDHDAVGLRDPDLAAVEAALGG